MGKRAPDPEPPEALTLILREIEREQVPDKLLELARKLQDALIDQRKAQEAGYEKD